MEYCEYLNGLKYDNIWNLVKITKSSLTKKFKSNISETFLFLYV